MTADHDCPICGELCDCDGHDEEQIERADCAHDCNEIVCPVDDPSCTSRENECHDACEPPDPDEEA